MSKAVFFLSFPLLILLSLFFSVSRCYGNEWATVQRHQTILYQAGLIPAVRFYPLSARPYLPPSWPHHHLPLSLSRTCSTSFRPRYHFISFPFQLPIIMLMDRASDQVWVSERAREKWRGWGDTGMSEGPTFSLYLCHYLFLSFTSVAETLTAPVKLNKLMRMPAVLKGRCEFVNQHPEKKMH